MISRLKPFGYQGHLLGTDELGRDMLSRLLYGGRVSLTMGMVPVMLATLIGGMLGIVAGYAGKHINMAIMRTMDIFYAFPSILLAVAISGTMGGGLRNGMLTLTLVFIPLLCRIAETATTQVGHLDFVEAARASGAGLCSIIRHHILGNVLGPIFVYVSSLASVSILLADEPTTALDATVQIQVLILLRQLQEELGMGVIFVTHDLGVAAEIADTIAVMYAGRIIETGSVQAVLQRPLHPYMVVCQTDDRRKPPHVSVRFRARCSRCRIALS